MFKVIATIVVLLLNSWLTESFKDTAPEKSPYHFKESKENDSIHKVNPEVVSIFVAQNNTFLKTWDSNHTQEYYVNYRENPTYYKELTKFL